MQDIILQEYQVRKSNKEKTAFIEYIKTRLSHAGYDAESDITIEEKGKGILKSRNIVVGNPKTARVFFTAHYDTCAVIPFPNLMTPTNPVLFILFQVALVVLIFGFCFLLTLLFTIVTNNMFDSSVVMLVIVYAFLFHMLFGYRNKHTANDNTSGTITITKILEALPQEDRDKVCVVYFDNEEKGLFGSSFFYEKHKKEMNDKLLINFDCVGDGRDIVVLGKAKARKDDLYENFLHAFESCNGLYDVEFLSRDMLPMMFGSDQMHFNKGVGVCALRKSVIGRYVARIHTPFDTVCREENVNYIVDSMKNFIEAI